MKRFALLFSFLITLFSSLAQAQRVGVAFVSGGSFVSDSNLVFMPACPTPTVCNPGPGAPSYSFKIQTDHRYFLEAVPDVRLRNFKVASLYVEFPIVGVPSQSQNTSSPQIATSTRQVSTVYLTAAVKAKLLPAFPVAPFVTFGGGTARFLLGKGTDVEGALQFGGGVDIKTGLPHLGLRGEVRDFVSNENFDSLNVNVPPFYTATSGRGGMHRHNVLAGAGVVFNF